MSSWTRQRESHPPGRRGRRLRQDLRTGLRTPAPAQRAAAAPEPTEWAADASRPVLLPARGSPGALPALQREPAARARGPQRLHLPPGRRQEAGAQPAAGRRVPGDQAGQELLPRQVDRFPGTHAGEDPRAAPERPALRAGDSPARGAGRPGAPERLAGRGAGAPQRHRRRSAQDGRPRGRRHRHGALGGDLYLRRLAGLGRL